MKPIASHLSPRHWPLAIVFGLAGVICLPASAQVNPTPFEVAVHVAAFARQRDAIRALAKAGADLNLLAAVRAIKPRSRR